MTISLMNPKPILFFFLIVSILSSQVLCESKTEANECEEVSGTCIDKASALKLKIIAIAAILATSMIGVCLPLFTGKIPALRPDGNIFIIVKSFASGIILGTGMMHVLPDSFAQLSSSCLPEKPWHTFPFAGFVAMISAIITLMMDSLSTSFYSQKKDQEKAVGRVGNDLESGVELKGSQFHSLAHSKEPETDTVDSQLLRYRVIAMVLESGIIVHSVVIGLSMGASNNKCTIRPLVAAICFHQMFEGMGLGGCILQAEYKKWKRTIMVFFFSITTPFGIVLGIALSKTYKENSPHALATVGILDASSAGLLIYMALVDLLAADFMGPKLQSSIKLQLKSFSAVILGCTGMAVLAKWA